MNQEHHSSKSEDKNKDLEKKVERLERTLELYKQTIDHDKQMKLEKPLQFGKYEMT
tara:strand:- start:545 stop:712 length:168 start_codon:yes stop_codon:yes gene_type:complete